MSGKSFKGNLEVLNLSDIFQSLAMNRHSGTLVVNDGKREKKIFFAEGEISLLSSGRRMRLGDLLIANGKITEDDLDLALKLQKQSRKKLGEILCEEGFCDEDDINQLLRQQIEEELYDLFLWRKAEFEFLADQMPDDMIRESPNLTRLSINTNSLIMEALRRLDEWSLIQDAVPTTKEVFVVADADVIAGSDVPDVFKAEFAAIDGKTTVEGLAERFFSSEFELCQHLATLVKAGGIRPLTQEELVERAETAYALNDFAGAAALYGRLAEYHPDQAKIMIPLADSLRRTGVDKQALSIYETLSEQLERGGEDPDRLRQCYEAMVQLDPSRHDLVRKIEDLDLRLAANSSKRGVVPILLVLLLVAGGAVFAFKDKLFGPGVTEPEDDVGALVETMRRLEDQATRLAEQGKVDETMSALQKWNAVALEIWREHPDSPEFAKVELPILVSTTPAGFEVYVNGDYAALTSLGKPDQVCKFRPPSPEKVVVEVYDPQGKNSDKPPRFSFESDDLSRVHHVPASIYDDPVPTFIADGWIDGGVVAAPELKDALIGVSRTGKLRAFRLDGSNLELVKGLDNAVTLGEFGDTFSPPALLGNRLFVGVTRFDGAGGVVALDLREGADPPRPEAVYKAPGQVRIRPILVDAAAGLDGGRVVFATLRADLVGYRLEGGPEPLWTTSVDGVVSQPLLRWADPIGSAAAGAVIAVTGADRVAAVSVSNGALLWSCVLDAAPVGPATRYGDRIVVPLADGRVLDLDPATGAVSKTLYTEPAGEAVSLLAQGDVLFAVSRKGVARALRADAVAWERELLRACKETMPRLAIMGDRLIVAMETPELIGLLTRDGQIAWQGRFSKSGAAGRPISPITVLGSTVLIGTDWQKIHVFRNVGGGE